jgi:xylose isomerase
VSLVDLRYQKVRRSPEELLNHRRTFKLDVKPSVGIWYLAPGGGRFHEGYTKPMSIEQRIELAAEMARFGVKGIEALPHERILDCYFDPAQHRGDLEMLLMESLASKH